MTTTVLTREPRFLFLQTLQRRFGLDATKLKIFALVLMVIDHIHQMWAYAGAPTWLTMIGRLVFPIFLFLMADSFHYTRDRKKFLTRLLVASWAMIVGSAIITALFPNYQVMLINNAFSTFFVAGLYMWFYDIIRNGVRNQNRKQILKGALLCLIPIITSIPVMLVGTLSANPNIPFAVIRGLLYVGMLIPNIMMVEGGFLFVILGLLFYIAREHRLVQVAILGVFSILMVVMGGLENIQWMMVFSAIPMLLYNTKPGRGMKDFFYVFYPAHIWLLYIISTLMLMFGITHVIPGF